MVITFRELAEKLDKVQRRRECNRAECEMERGKLSELQDKLDSLEQKQVERHCDRSVPAPIQEDDKEKDLDRERNV